MHPQIFRHGFFRTPLDQGKNVLSQAAQNIVAQHTFQLHRAFHIRDSNGKMKLYTH